MIFRKTGIHFSGSCSKAAPSEIRRSKLVGPFAAALVCFLGRRVDRRPAGIEGREQGRLVARHGRLQLLERILADIERPFHRAVMAPEAHGAPRRIEHPALIGKIEHDSSAPFSFRVGNPAFAQAFGIAHPPIITLRIVPGHIECFQMLLHRDQGFLARREAATDLARRRRYCVLELENLEHRRPPGRSYQGNALSGPIKSRRFRSRACLQSSKFGFAEDTRSLSETTRSWDSLLLLTRYCGSPPPSIGRRLTIW